MADREVLQRERKDGVASGLPVAAYGIVLLIVIALIAALGWALRRLAGAEGRPPRDDRPGTGAAARAAPA